MNSRTTTRFTSDDPAPTDAGPNEPLWRLEREAVQILITESRYATGIEKCIRLVCEQQDWPGGAFWRLDEATGAVVEGASWPHSDPVAMPESGSGSALPSWVRDEPVWISPLSADELNAQLPQECWRPPYPGLYLPVRSAQRLFGILSFQSPASDSAEARPTESLGMLPTMIGRFCERAEAADRLLEMEQRFESTLALAAIGIAHVDDSGQFLYANPQLCKMLGYSERELVGLNIRQVSHPDDAHATDELRRKLRNRQIESFKIEKRYLRKDRTPIWVALTIAAMPDVAGHRTCDISIVEDISARKLAEERAQYLATHDALTGLPNRALFGQLLSVAIEDARRRDTELAVLFIDLDRFKIINDSMGHDAGDLLLRAMATRFRECLRDFDVVARLGGDEFVVLLPGISGQSQVSLIAKQLLHAAMRPVEVHGQECRVTASIGICVHPHPGLTTLRRVRYQGPFTADDPTMNGLKSTPTRRWLARLSFVLAGPGDRDPAGSYRAEEPGHGRGPGRRGLLPFPAGHLALAVTRGLRPGADRGDRRPRVRGPAADSGPVGCGLGCSRA